MTHMWLYALGSVIIVSLISLIGGVFLTFSRRAIDQVIFYLVALASGTMLGNAIVHLLPEAFEETSSPLLTSCLVLAGIVGSLIFEKVLNLRCHHAGGCHGSGHCSEEANPNHGAVPGHIHPTGWMSLVSHGMDNLIDGVLIGVAYLVSIPVGVATTIAIIMHEIPMELGGFGVLVDSGFSKKRALTVNFASGLISVAATVATLVLGEYVEGMTVYLAPVAAGTILYITTAGLMPKMQKETSALRSLVQITVMLIGLAIMVAVRCLE